MMHGKRCTVTVGHRTALPVLAVSTFSGTRTIGQFPHLLEDRVIQPKIGDRIRGSIPNWLRVSTTDPNVPGGPDDEVTTGALAAVTRREILDRDICFAVEQKLVAKREQIRANRRHSALVIDEELGHCQNFATTQFIARVHFGHFHAVVRLGLEPGNAQGLKLAEQQRKHTEILARHRVLCHGRKTMTLKTVHQSSRLVEVDRVIDTDLESRDAGIDELGNHLVGEQIAVRKHARLHPLALGQIRNPKTQVAIRVIGRFATRQCDEPNVLFDHRIVQDFLDEIIVEHGLLIAAQLQTETALAVAGVADSEFERCESRCHGVGTPLPRMCRKT